MHALVRSGEIDLLALDSIAQMVPATETEESSEKWQQGLQARLINKMSRTLTASGTAVRRDTGRLVTQIWLNQTRVKIGVMFGDPTTKPGGNGQDFATTIELKLWGGKTETENEVFGAKDDVLKRVVSEDVNFEVKKNKSAATKGQTGFYKQCLIAHDGLRKGQVIEHEFVFKLAMHRGLVEKTGPKYRLAGREFTSQVGIEKALLEDVVLYGEVQDMLLQHAMKEMNS
jgi:recombination protein RecA